MPAARSVVVLFAAAEPSVQADDFRPGTAGRSTAPLPASSRPAIDDNAAARLRTHGAIVPVLRGGHGRSGDRERSLRDDTILSSFRRCRCRMAARMVAEARARAAALQGFGPKRARLEHARSGAIIHFDAGGFRRCLRPIATIAGGEIERLQRIA
jgi:hypothetical protein